MVPGAPIDLPVYPLPVEPVMKGILPYFSFTGKRVTERFFDNHYNPA